VEILRSWVQQNQIRASEMNYSDNLQSNNQLHQEIGNLRQRIAELESDKKPTVPTTYADFLFENSGETILIIDPYTLRILDANPNAARRLGYRQSDLCQMSLETIEMPRPLDMNDAETSWQSSVSGTFFYEGQYRHKNGTLIPMEVSSRLVSWEGQDVLINFVRDIRWRKEAEVALRQVNNSLEQQVRQRTAELASEKDKLETVLGTIVEGVAMTDTEKKIVYVNPAFVMLTHYTLEEAQTQTIDQLFDYSVKDRQAQAIAFAKGKAWSGEVKGLRKDGRSYPAVFTIVPMLAVDGRLTGYVTSHQDISRFKALDKAQYSFITNVSHQLRTPLTNIKLYTELLEGGLSNGKAAHYLHVLNEQAKRLEHLVQDILELASMDSAELNLDLRPYKIDEMVTHMADTYRAQAAMNQHTFDYTIQEAVPAIEGDAARLRQAFAELLDNAFAYTPAGGTISLAIKVVPELDRQWVALTVQDDGPGILPEDQPQIFERFFRGRLAEQGHIIGTGLGLCIAQQIIEAHRGHITLESELGVGTTFTVWLPVETALDHFTLA
jgi:PAS domain S-box-containing protein